MVNFDISQSSEMEKIWTYIFEDELKISPENQPIILTETSMNPRPNREKMTEVLYNLSIVMLPCIEISKSSNLII